MADPDAPTLTISLVIPAYNEEAVIERTVVELCTVLRAAGFPFEIVVADDGSTDGTWALLERLQAAHPELRPVRNTGPGGYGMAVRAGLTAYGGDAVIVTMADGSDSPDDIVAYARAMQDGADCAFGSRFDGTTVVAGYPPVKRLLNRLANRLIAWAVGQPYYDFTNGFKGYRRWVVDAMQPLVCADFNLTVEMSMKAVLSGARYRVIANSWRDREGGESKFRLARLGPRYAMAAIYCLAGNYLKKAGARPRGPA